jgi:hypothetical protein
MKSKKNRSRKKPAPASPAAPPDFKFAFQALQAHFSGVPMEKITCVRRVFPARLRVDLQDALRQTELRAGERAGSQIRSATKPFRHIAGDGLLCNGVCVDLQTNVNNCGVCGNVCTARTVTRSINSIALRPGPLTPVCIAGHCGLAGPPARTRPVD